MRRHLNHSWATELGDASWGSKLRGSVLLEHPSQGGYVPVLREEPLELAQWGSGKRRDGAIVGNEDLKTSFERLGRHERFVELCLAVSQIREEALLNWTVPLADSVGTRIDGRVWGCFPHSRVWGCFPRSY